MNSVPLNELATLWAPAMLRACWQGALAVGAVWLLCRLLPRLSPVTRAALWWLACGKLILGLLAVPLLPVAVLPAEVESLPPAQAAAPVFLPDSMAVAPAPGTPVALPPRMATSASPSGLELPAPLTLLFLAWIAGVLTLLALAAQEQSRIQRLIADARPCADLELLARLAAVEDLRRVPPVLVSTTLPGSVAVGIWKPKIVLAEADLAGLGPDEKWALLAHELAHIRRSDLWLGLLPNLARLLFFFHPLVWLACREYELAREAACDAESLRVSGLPTADYGRLLLKLSQPPLGQALRPGAAALGVASPHARILLRRLQGLQKLKDSGALPQWCSLLVLALVGTLLCLTPTRARLRTLIQPPAPAAAPSMPVVDTIEAPLPPVITRANSAPVKALDTSSVSSVKGTRTPMKFFVKTAPKLSRAATAVAALATVGAPTMMATTAASAQETPPLPAAPPVPVVAPAAGAAVPALPAAPLAPEAPVLAVFQARKYQYTLRMGTSYSNHSQSREVAAAQRKLAEAQPGDCLVVDRDGKRYLITDPVTLRQIKENYAAVEAKGKLMELKGKEMEKIGFPMEAFGKQMEAFGKLMEARGKEMGLLGEKMATANEAERQALQEQMKALRDQMKMPSEEMRALAKKMREQGDKMRIPGNELREMGNQMRAAAKEAEERLTTILDNAFKNNLAVEQAGSTGSPTGEIALD